MPVSTIAAVPEPGVVVEIVGGQAIVSHEVVGQGDLAVEPCAADASTDWYFAAGTTVRGSQQFLALFNPFGDDAIVDISFVTDTGVMEPDGTQGVVVPRRSRVSIPVHDSVERRCSSRRTCTREPVGWSPSARSSSTDRCRRTCRCARASRSRWARSLPNATWEFGFGDSANGAAQSVAIANFGDRATSVEVAVRLDNDQSVRARSG